MSLQSPKIKYFWKPFFAILLLNIVSIATAAAQSSTGTINGRILNAASGAYLRNAEITVAGTQIMAVSEEGGFYMIPNAPVGKIQLTVRYMGLGTQEKSVTVPSGGRVNLDFDLLPSDGRTGAGEKVIVLEKFEVSAEREGNSRAIMEQRNTMNMTQVVATDVFGDNHEGNVGEFLKFLPGVGFGGTAADDGVISEISLGGMEAKYTGVSMDGATLAGAAGSSTSRTFDFSALSISSIESIEVATTVSADMDGSSPGGTITMRSKSGFDQKNRRIDYSITMSGNSRELSFSRSPGPRDGYSRKLHPAIELNYSNSFLRNTLGVSFNFKHYLTYKAQTYMSMGFGGFGATDPDPASGTVGNKRHVKEINYREGAHVNSSDSIGGKIDYRISSAAQLALSLNYSRSDGEYHNRGYSFFPDNNSNTSTLIFVQSSTFGNISSSTFPDASYRGNETFSSNLKFDYKKGRFRYDAVGSYSVSENEYHNSDSTAPFVYSAPISVNRVPYIAERKNSKSPGWTFRLVREPGTPEYKDWSDPKNWTVGNIITGRTRNSKNQNYEGSMNLTWFAPTTFKLAVKTGLKSRMEKRHIIPWGEATLDIWKYTPPAGAGEGITDFVSPVHPSGSYGGNFTDLNLPAADYGALYEIYKNDPYLTYPTADDPRYLLKNKEHFTRHTQSDRNYNLYPDFIKELNGAWDLTETISAGYIKVTASPHRKIDVEAGLRYEMTEQETKVMIGRSAREMRLKGYYDSAKQTPEYIKMKYRNGERTTTNNDYAYLLPSAALKYKIRPNLALHFAAGETINRVDIEKIAGGWDIRDGDPLIAVAPNPKLEPDNFATYSVRLEYYPGENGKFNVSYNTRRWNGRSYTRMTVNDDPAAMADLRDEYGNETIDFLLNNGYEIQTYTDNEKIPRQVDTFEIDYYQRVRFLKGVSIFSNLTRVMSDYNRNDICPLRINGGISYSYKRFSTNINGTWSDRTIVENHGRPNETGRNARFTIDFSANFALIKQLRLTVSARNVLNEPSRRYYGSTDVLHIYSDNGVALSFGVKGTF